MSFHCSTLSPRPFSHIFGSLLRKRKFQNLQEEESVLKKRNIELLMKCRSMEDLVRALKQQFIDKVSNPRKEPVDLEAILKQFS